MSTGEGEAFGRWVDTFRWRYGYALEFTYPENGAAPSPRVALVSGAIVCLVDRVAVVTVLAATAWRTNAEMIEAAASLGYLRKEWVTLDPTYGRGLFWTNWRPDNLVCRDRYTIEGDEEFTFEDMHCYPDGAFDCVVFDPPYRLNGTPDLCEFDDRFGTDKPMTWHERMASIEKGISESLRVTRSGGMVLVKCQDQVCSGAVRWQTREFADHAEERGRASRGHAALHHTAATATARPSSGTCAPEPLDAARAEGCVMGHTNNTKAERERRAELATRGLKHCPKCEQDKPFDEFHKNKARFDGLNGMCKACMSVAAHRWQAANKERKAETNRRWAEANPGRKAELGRRAQLKRKGITQEQFDEMLEAQGGRCANTRCGATEPGGVGTWHIDHDHECCPTAEKSCRKCIRGLLCDACNKAAGFLRDDMPRIIGLAHYLARHRHPLKTAK